MITINLQALRQEVESLTEVRVLEELRAKYLGRQGLINQEFQKFGKLSPEARSELGDQLNKLKNKVSEIIDGRLHLLESQQLAAQLAAEAIDVTLPPKERNFGALHPIPYVAQEIANIFASMGFKLVDGPDIESEHYNFTALNFPLNHPAKECHDTFYVQPLEGKQPAGDSSAANDRFLLRTHTSNVQIREMEASKPPFKFISLGKVYRCDSDATHTPMFHQIEGVYIDEKANMAQLKGCLYEFARTFFASSGMKVRFRPSFFPFVEPGGEVDISFEGSDKWLEILGCGMVHPNVLTNVGLDPTRYQGFAFGMGIERCAMLKYGIKDCRAFYEGDIRWLKHYGFRFFK